MSPYAVLGVSANATDQEIKNAYRRLVKRYHPDRGLPEASHEQIAAINQAYDILSDPEKRAQFDRGFARIFFEQPQREDPVEAYKQEFKRRRWEREKQEREWALARKKAVYRGLRSVNMVIFVFAFGLFFYDLLFTRDMIEFFHVVLFANSGYICYKKEYTVFAYKLAAVTCFLFAVILLYMLS